MRSYAETADIVLQELGQALFQIHEEEVQKLTADILGARKVFTVGVGRVLLSLQAWVKRLTQLGIEAYFVGEVNEPAITKDDILIVGSGSGCSLIPEAIAKKAKEFQAKVIHIGSNPQGAVSPYIDYMVRIPVQTKLYLEDEIRSGQPMTSLFEQSLYVLGDIISMLIIEKKEMELKKLWEYHANLE